MDEEEFDGCSSQCRKKGKHSLVYGSCELGQQPKPTLGFFVVEDGEDGYPVGVIIPIEASVFIPWLDDLSLNDQYALLERLARAQPKQQRIIIESEGQR